MSWQKIWLVLSREYRYNFRRPSFLFTAFGVPLFSIAAMFLVIHVVTDRETNLDNYQRIGYVDRAGVISADAPNQDGYQPVTDPAVEAPGASASEAEQTAYYDALEAAARQQLVNDQIDAFFVITDLYTLTGQIDLYGIKGPPAALRDNIEDFLRDQIVAQAPDTLPVSTARLHKPVDMTIRDLDSDDKLSTAALIGRMLLPFVFVFLYFMSANTTAQFLMSGVVEEKENRLMEILATSLRPIELLWGKMLGLGALALTQAALWAAGALVIAVLYEGAREFLTGASFQVGDIVLIIGLFVINFLLFSAIMLGIGASSTAEAESRQFAGFMTFIAVLPLALSSLFFMNPDGSLPLFFTFFPLTAATALIMRMGLTSLPNWQIALSLGIQLVSVLAVMWLAAKVFRLGMLMYGKPLTPRTLWQALRAGQKTLTTAQDEAPVRKPRKKRSLFRL
ncbi:MAG: ABC transporter permease [Anaerolineae bacterium]|nr:ABC transporter permease [Anaerolineae bacterium]